MPRRAGIPAGSAGCGSLSLPPLTTIESALEEVRAMKQQLGSVLGTGSRYLMDHLIEVRLLDRRWTRRLLADVESGAVRDLAPAAIRQLALRSR